MTSQRRVVVNPLVWIAVIGFTATALLSAPAAHPFYISWRNLNHSPSPSPSPRPSSVVQAKNSTNQSQTNSSSDSSYDALMQLDELKEDEDVRLNRVLKASAMNDNTVILTTLNSAWAEEGSMIDVFLESMKYGNGTRQLIRHLLIVAFDLKAYVRCKNIHTHCFALSTEGVDFSGEESFMTNTYLLMMWRRTQFLGVVLQKGYNFILTDADIMWFKNPLPYFYKDADFQIACDKFTGDPASLDNSANGGFVYAKSNNHTIEFYKFWYSSHEEQPKHNEQTMFNMIKRHPYTKEIGVRIEFLDTDYFGDLCQPSRDLDKVCTMHANCCIGGGGLNAKLHDLRVLIDDYKNYQMRPPWRKDSTRYSWSLLQLQCG